jgi:hypothetical protein
MFTVLGSMLYFPAKHFNAEEDRPQYTLSPYESQVLSSLGLLLKTVARVRQRRGDHRIAWRFGVQTELVGLLMPCA